MVLVERILKLHANGVTIDVPVRIFAPADCGRSWFCKWEIHWPDRVFSLDAGGADALQALLHAMQMIGAALYCSPEHKSGRLGWTKPGEGYGFPVGRGSRDLLEGEDAEFL